MWHCSLLNVGGKLVLQASINNPNQTRKTSHGRRQQGDNVGMQTCMWSIDCGDVTWSNWNDITGLLRAKVFSNSGLHTYFFPLQLFYSLYFICLHRKGSKVFYCWKVFFSFFFSCKSLSFCQTDSSKSFVWLHSPSRPKCSPPHLSKHFPPLKSIQSCPIIKHTYPYPSQGGFMTFYFLMRIKPMPELKLGKGRKVLFKLILIEEITQRIKALWVGNMTTALYSLCSRFHFEEWAISKWEFCHLVAIRGHCFVFGGGSRSHLKVTLWKILRKKKIFCRLYHDK